MQHIYVNIRLIYVNMQHNYINMRKVQKVYQNIYFTTLVRHMCEFDVVVDYWYSSSFVSQITGSTKNTDHRALLTTRMSNEKNLLWTNECVKRSGIPPIIGEFL